LPLSNIAEPKASTEGGPVPQGTRPEDDTRKIIEVARNTNTMTTNKNLSIFSRHNNDYQGITINGKTGGTPG
jgi:lipopolysaccharide export LptBFGC system permease protein LptF